MKLRWKILLIIALAWLLTWIYQTAANLGNRESQTSFSRCEGLDAWYRDYNDNYFQNRLPKNTVVDYSEHRDDIMAATSQFDDGRFHIAFNEKYAKSARFAHLLMLHEQCHIDTWDEKEEHGKRWRACMLVVEFEGAFRGILIDGYTGDE